MTDLIPAEIQAMIDNEGVYVCGDTKHPASAGVIISHGQKLWSTQLDKTLAPDRFLPTLTIGGPFLQPSPERDELARLEREIAEEGAIALLECELRHAEDDWLDTTTYDEVDPVAELRYLELRGLLERHPERPELVRVKSEDT